MFWNVTGGWVTGADVNPILRQDTEFMFLLLHYVTERESKKEPLYNPAN